VVKVETILTQERREALEKFLDMLVKMNELGLLDTIRDLLDPEFIGRLSELLMTPGTLKLLDHIDDLLDLAGSIDVEAIKGNMPLIRAALEALSREPKPVGITGLMRAMSDPDVQKGLGLMVELLKAIGKTKTK
jgi:uncharacterized protein YjgD (DUF1641 family)